ncbi:MULTISPECIES: hypothetical protein [unclassified Acinetobacter]|uniref:hypothetical protein n=1 Tax=unclassified Acinetobacter TaxID=196816 RepID=UPI0035BB0E64
MNKILCSLFFMGIACSAQAEVKPTPEQKQQFEHAVDHAVYSHVLLRHSMLSIVSPYAYDNVDMKTLSLEKIKIYVVNKPSIMQCVVNQVQPRNYQTALQQSLKSYYLSVSPEQFTADFEYLTAPKRQEYYQLQQQSMQDFSKIKVNDIMAENSAETLAQIKKATTKLEQFSANTPEEQWQDKSESFMDESSRQPLLNLLGLSLANTPFEADKSLPKASPMSIYSQKVINDCHKNFWKQTYQDLHAKRKN